MMTRGLAYSHFSTLGALNRMAVTNEVISPPRLLNLGSSFTPSLHAGCKKSRCAAHVGERINVASGIICSQSQEKGRNLRLPALNSASHSERRVARSAVADSAVVGASAAKAIAEAESREWVWYYEGRQIKVNYVVHNKSGGASGGDEDAVFLPAISDVSTVDEFAAVAKAVVEGAPRLRQAVVVDWPGFGFSDRPVLEYKEAILSAFLADFLGSKGPLSGTVPIIIGAGHAGSIAARAVGVGSVKARAIAVVAPTWAGPLPIVFGKDDTMEGRYGLFRGVLLAPFLGDAIYKYTVASPSNIRMQYLTHVYSDPDNLPETLVEARAELPKKENARYGPAAFLTGQLDPVSTREEFLGLFAELESRGVPALVLKSTKSPRRSRAEMDALQGAKGVTKFVEVRGALLAHEEFPEDVTTEILAFLQEL